MGKHRRTRSSSNLPPAPGLYRVMDVTLARECKLMAVCSRCWFLFDVTQPIRAGWTVGRPLVHLCPRCGQEGTYADESSQESPRAGRQPQVAPPATGDAIGVPGLFDRLAGGSGDTATTDE